MSYPETFIAPMRRDLTQYGVEEARTPEDVDRILNSTDGTVLMVINAVCGCAAGKARPAIGMALKHRAVPDRAATVFAGADIEATAHLRELLVGYPVSSPAMALFHQGKPVMMIHRSDIESNDPLQLTRMLTEAFDQYCTKAEAAKA
ncbi:MAG: BrxA/BrxB family bacilliredoxin [Bryobacteraceae bacterium]